MAHTSLVAPLFEGELDIVGDVHGELTELTSLLRALGYDADGEHPEGRRLVFVGDLCDRGHDSPGVLKLVARLVEEGLAQCILGNHELNLLRKDLKHGNAWYLDPQHEEQHGEFKHSRAVPPEHAFHRFFLGLPLALEREDLRVVHAAWHAPSIQSLRSEQRDALTLFEHYEAATDEWLAREGIAAAAIVEKNHYAKQLTDPSATVPLLRNLGLLDEHRQTRNPIRVLTSGPERVAISPFFANGKWRMCDRVLWWNEYKDSTPVIIGHYWRLADRDEVVEAELSGGKPNLFADHAPNEWGGAAGNVFCVDFSIGGRYRERARGGTEYRTRLAAVRWPERVLVFADGESLTVASSQRQRA